MLRPRFQVLSVALVAAVMLVGVGGTPRRDMLTDMMGEDLTKDKDLVHLLLLKFVSDSDAARERETLPESGEQEAGVREAVRRHLPLVQRERKAGCRNFFWKTFTSC